MACDELEDYFRLHDCADTHVCNDLSRFTEHKPLHSETIHLANSDTNIETTGRVVTVHVNTNSGSGLVDLEDVAYVPNVH